MRNCGATEIGLSCLKSNLCGDKTAQVTVETGGGVETGLWSGVSALNDGVDGADAAESEPPAALRGPCQNQVLQLMRVADATADAGG